MQLEKYHALQIFDAVSVGEDVQAGMTLKDGTEVVNAAQGEHTQFNHGE